MRTIKIDPTNADHTNGPYLLFVRSKMAFSDHHKFQDWPFLAADASSMIWGTNAVLRLVNRAEHLADIGDIPDWIDQIEIALISAEFGIAGFRRLGRSYWEDGTRWGINHYPNATNLTTFISPNITADKRFFDRRMLVIFYADDFTEQQIARQNTHIRRRLGQKSSIVWHSSNLFGFAFHDARKPADIATSLADVLTKDKIHDAACFKLAAVATERGVPSPLGLFLTLGARTGRAGP